MSIKALALQTPDKTNDMIFLKSPNAIFGPLLTIFCHLPDGIFSKKSGCHTQLYMGP